MKEVYWPGRLQAVGKQLLLDGAHNPAGASALRAALTELFPARECLFVFSCFENKDAEGFLANLINPGDRLFLAQASGQRKSFSKERLEALAEKMQFELYSFASIEAAPNLFLQFHNVANIYFLAIVILQVIGPPLFFIAEC